MAPVRAPVAVGDGGGEVRLEPGVWGPVAPVPVGEGGAEVTPELGVEGRPDSRTEGGRNSEH